MLERATRLCAMSPQMAHGQPAEPPARPADGEGIQKRLRRMFVPPVSGVEHRAFHLLREEVGSTGVRMPDDQEVRIHRVQRQRRVDQGFALPDGTRAQDHVHDVGPEALTGELETRLRSRGVLEEHVDQGQAQEFVGTLGGTPVEVHVVIGKVQDGFDVGRR